MTTDTAVSQEHFADKKTGQRRAFGLDALRGVAILTMALSGYVPWGVLPSWMYHAQVPPPDHVFDPSIPGITWVDLVFPFFLFAMGAAIPLALSRRIKKGYPTWKTVRYIFERGILLAAFGIVYQQVRPWVMSNNPTTSTWLTALLGFALLFPMYMRLPRTFSPALSWSIKGAGWLGMIVLLATLTFPDGTGFSLYRSDIIIMVLANTVVAGSLIWLVSQNNILLRLGFLGLLLGLRLSSTVEGWGSEVWNYSPLPWLCKLEYLKYLFIVVPGTIIGDLILRWMTTTSEDVPAKKTWGTDRLIAITLLMVVFNVFLLCGLKGRWIPGTYYVSFLLCGLGFLLVMKPTTSTQRFLHNLYLWGVYWLVFGLLFEPFEGGIKKDHATFSYFFVTTGLAIFLLIAFTIIIDILNKKRWLSLLVDNGQNPMIAYAGIQNLVLAVLVLTGLNQVLNTIFSTPWPGAFLGLIKTLLLALAVSFCTRRKIFWRT